MKWFDLHHHPRSPAERTVIHGLMAVMRPLAKLMNSQIKRSRFLSPTED